MSDNRADRVLELAWLIEEVLQAASAGDYSGRCPVSISESFADNPLTTITPSINLLLDDLKAKERAQRRIEAMLLAALGELETRLGTIEERAETSARLPTPVLEVWDDVLAVPVIGPIDEERVQAIMERMLGVIAKTKAECVILDITGVETVDSATTENLLRMVHAARKQGVHCVLTGTRDHAAQTLANNAELTILPTLKDGLRSCRDHLAKTKPPAQPE